MILRQQKLLARRVRAGLIGACFAAVLAGCSSVKLDDVPVETATQVPVDASSGVGGSAASGTTDGRVAPVDLAAPGSDAEAARLGRVVYFDFDSYAVKDEYRPIIERYAKLLSSDRPKHLVVEGYTDDRGGSEYNLALGQKRAEAVAQSLVLSGAVDAQVEAVSYGKERAAVEGDDESARAKNRRAELSLR